MSLSVWKLNTKKGEEKETGLPQKYQTIRYFRIQKRYIYGNLGV